MFNNGDSPMDAKTLPIGKKKENRTIQMIIKREMAKPTMIHYGMLAEKKEV